MIDDYLKNLDDLILAADAIVNIEILRKNIMDLQFYLQ